MNCWIGVDPGGTNAFGVAILEPSGIARSWCVSSASEAIVCLTEQMAVPPSGAGVDAPLWWSSGPGGGREADSWLRTRYKISSGTVQSANSLRGAALVQAALFIEGIRLRWPSLQVTESHPKALMLALGLRSWSEIADRYNVSMAQPPRSEHERDAVLGAIAAREGFEGRWKRDLSLVRSPDEQDPSRYWLAPVRYWWPAD